MSENINNRAITPPWLIAMGTKVLGRIDLDPASSARANRIIEARVYINKSLNGLGPWVLPPRLTHNISKTLHLKGAMYSDQKPRGPISIWLNPPGGKEPFAKVSEHLRPPFPLTRDPVSRIKLWWNRLLWERHQRHFGHALFLAFNVEAIRLTQTGCGKSLLDYYTCIPRYRINFLDPLTGKVMRGNRFQSAITYIPGRINRAGTFRKVFGELGQIVKAV